MDKFWDWCEDTTYYLRRHIKSIKCFFIGHNIRWGCEETYDPDWCDYCWKDDPYEMPTFNDYMNTVFVWIIEHTTEDFVDRLLSWKPLKQMPSWWEY